MAAKFPGKYSTYSFKFPVGTQIKFDKSKRIAEHVTCSEVSYDGAEQASIFNNWIRIAQEVERNQQRITP